MAPVIIGRDSRPILITSKVLSSNGSGIPSISSEELPPYAVGLFESNGRGPRKRKRLTHLTAEEKIMRRKLKNRVAAQTARDRKKARLETLEDVVTKIHEQTRKLLDFNAQLLESAEAYKKENQALRKRLDLEATESCIPGKREELVMIKRESSETFQSEAVSESDRKGFCVSTSCEKSVIVNDGPSFAEVLSPKASKCVSPVPAAGSCQSSEADPLASRERRSIVPASNVNDSVGDSVEDEPDITSLLQALEAVDPEQCFFPNIEKEGNATGSQKILADNVTTNIEVPANSSSHHEYIKPAPCLLRDNRTSGCQPPNLFVPTAETSFQSPSKGSNKLSVLVEEPTECTQQLDLQVPSELMNAIAPYTESTSASNGPQSDDIDAVLDSLFLNDARSVDSSSETESTDSAVSSCDSSLSCLLDTPSPLSISDCTDPFDCGFFDGQLDLFPQLAVM